MQTLTIEIDDCNIQFFLELLQKLNIQVKVKSTSKNNLSLSKDKSPFHLPEGKPAIDDFAGIWSDNPKSLSSIREKAWKKK